MTRLVVWSWFLALPGAALGLGIRLFDHDAFATARGNAFVATADNPSALYYNPAGISQLRGHNVRGGIYTVNAHSEFEPAFGSGTYETKDEYIPIPGMFYVYASTNLPLSFGAAYYTPYGLSLEWPAKAPFRAVTTRGDLAYHTISALASWQVCPTLSIAAGPTFNYSSTKLGRGVAVPGDPFSFKGDGSAWGGVAGVLWRPTTRHAFGLSYRRQTTINFSGRSRTNPLPLPEQHAELELTFPQVVVGGYSFRPNTNWNFEVNLDWTDWDEIGTLMLKQGSGNMPLPLRWESSWAVEAGATHYLNNGLRLSTGYVFIQNSTPTRTFNPLVPDQDLHVFSGGLGGDIDRFSWDFTYQFTWGPGRSVSGSATAASVAGDYAFTAHALSVSLGWHF